MPQLSLQQAFDLAVKHHMAGQLQPAEQLYRQILSADPKHRDALHFLGLLAHQAGRSDAGVELIRQSIALGLNTPDVLGNLGNALKGNGQLDESIAAYSQSLVLNPRLPATHINLGVAFQAKGDFENAIAAFRKAIELNPGIPEAYNNLSSALADSGKFDDAIIAAGNGIALRPGYTDAFINLGNAHRFKGEFNESIAAYEKALATAPPATGVDPNLAKVQSNLGSAFKDLGQVEEALAAYRAAARLDPADPKHGDNILLMLQYHPGYDAKSIAAENEQWNRQHARPLAKLPRSYSNDRDPNRRLRIGYVSPDFKDHAVGRNVLPLFRNHDRQDFEIVCYSNSHSTDPIATEFQRLAGSFIQINHLSDQQATVKIHHERIDILVDLALHTSGNRLPIFARKPAPVQATFAGYPAGTGLTAIDYRLSDPYLDPREIDESIYSEKTIRLPNSFWCYDPLDCADIAVNPLPAQARGVITFGCLNNFCKINDAVLSLWARVLRKVDHSRLMLLTRAGAPHPRTLDRLANEGIAAGRIHFIPTGARRGYLEAYHQIDIGLDTFPYNGHTTSLDSFWMGVPVVTLVGNRSVARAGWCQLANLGLIELAAHTNDQFVQIAAELASNLPRLAELRSTLRARLQQSPLMDAPRFARDIESAYRQMWRTWCAQ